MGWCHEFGVEITAGCDHLMVASRDCCECPECGTRCTGKFGGCEAVWARGPVAVQLVGREAPTPRRPEPVVAQTPPTWAPLPASPTPPARTPAPTPDRGAPRTQPGGQPGSHPAAARSGPSAAPPPTAPRPPTAQPPAGSPPGSPQDRNGRREEDRTPRRSTQPPGAAELHALRDTLSTAGLELKGRIDQLTGELEEFELRTRDEIIRRATDATLKAVSVELSKRDAQYNELHQTVATASTSLKRQVDELTATLAGVQTKVGELPVREVTATQQELSKTQAGLTKTQEGLTKTQEGLTTTQEGLTTTQAELSTTKTELTTTKTELTTTKTELTKTQEALTKTSADLAATQAAFATTREQLGKTQELLDASGQRIDALDKRMSLAPDGDVLGRQLNAMLTQSLAARDARIEKVDARIATVDARIETAEARLQTIPEVDTLLKRVKATMSEALTARDARIDGRVQELRDTLAAAAAAIETLEQKVASAPAAEVFDERVTAAENRLTESQRKVVAAQQLLKRQLDQLTSGLTGVQTSVKEMPDENEVNRRVRAAVVETVTDALVARDTQVQELREAQGRDRMGLEALEARVSTLADRDEIVRATTTTMSEAFTPRDRRLKKVESDISEQSKALERRFEDSSSGLQRRIDELAGKLIALESRVSDMPDEEELVRSMGQIVARALSGEMIAQSLANARRTPERGAGGPDRGTERERDRPEPRRPER